MVDARRLLDALVGGSEGLLTARTGRRLAMNLAGLGGLALIGGLAYKALQASQPGSGPAPHEADSVSSTPDPAAKAVAFDPTSASEDDIVLCLRAMAAAAVADGQVDATERARLVDAVTRAGLGADTAVWFERELAAPWTAEGIADRVQTPEKAAQVYAAACLVVDPDTLQEREFLRRLAALLDLDPQSRMRIDDAITEAHAGS